MPALTRQRSISVSRGSARSRGRQSSRWRKRFPSRRSLTCRSKNSTHSRARSFRVASKPLPASTCRSFPNAVFNTARCRRNNCAGRCPIRRPSYGGSFWQCILEWLTEAPAFLLLSTHTTDDWRKSAMGTLYYGDTYGGPGEMREPDALRVRGERGRSARSVRLLTWLRAIAWLRIGWSASGPTCPPDLRV